MEHATTAERFEVLIVLAGRGRIESGGDSLPYDRAEAWLLPAALGAYRLAPEAATTMIRTYVPDLAAFTQQLAQRGIEKALWPRVVHP